MHEDLSRLDSLLFETWNLGENIILVWTREGAELRFLAMRHYRILDPFGQAGDGRDVINQVFAGPKFVQSAEFERHCALLGSAARVVRASVREYGPLMPELIDGLVTRYGVSLVRERAVMLVDVVEFSLHTPLEQVAMLNSLGYSVNSAYRQLSSRNIEVDFARSSTGDGFYLWNRAKTLDANIALYKLMMLILTDNAVAQRKARRSPVPKLRAAFHVGEHYEFYQVEALNPTTYSYIVGQVTIELARMVEKALPGQILLGEFDISMPEGRTGKAVSYSTPEFIERTAAVLGQLEGLAVANDQIGVIRCYLTGEKATAGGFTVGRYSIRDKHSMTRAVYNAKINLYLEQGEPIFLGVQNKDLHPAGAPGAHWPLDV